LPAFAAALSVPVKLLKEGEGHMVTAELKTGEVYRGLLVESEDTMNLHLSEGVLPGRGRPCVFFPG
jgi:small nuclear ribonucleoprotein D3